MENQAVSMHPNDCIKKVFMSNVAILQFGAQNVNVAVIVCFADGHSKSSWPWTYLRQGKILTL